LETNNLQNINVSVAGRMLPLEINIDEEQFYRDAEKLLEKKVEYYEKKYSNKSRGDILGMAAYDAIVCLLRYCNPMDSAELAQKFSSFNEQIEDIL